jgi:hypothetical protein
VGKSEGLPEISDLEKLEVKSRSIELSRLDTGDHLGLNTQYRFIIFEILSAAAGQPLDVSHAYMKQSPRTGERSDISYDPRKIKLLGSCSGVTVIRGESHLHGLTPGFIEAEKHAWIQIFWPNKDEPEDFVTGPVINIYHKPAE